MQLMVFNYDQIENRFFELIKLHRENVNEMNFNFFVENLFTKWKGDFNQTKKNNLSSTCFLCPC
jgi:hypothetical protein